MKHCRDCDFWKSVGMWQGICTKDIFTKPQFGSKANPRIYGCEEYQDFKVQKYYNKEVKNATIRTS